MHGVETKSQFLLLEVHFDVKVGWDNEVKWRFFAPVLAAASLAAILMFIVLCNLATPAIRSLLMAVAI